MSLCSQYEAAFAKAKELSGEDCTDDADDGDASTKENPKKAIDIAKFLDWMAEVGVFKA